MSWPNWRIRDGVTTQNIQVKSSANLESDLRQCAMETTPLPPDFAPIGKEPSPQCVTGQGNSCFVFKYGMQEPVDYYLNCANRDRNQGLFIADQNVGKKAINTRQNPNGDRHGFECPEVFLNPAHTSR